MWSWFSICGFHIGAESPEVHVLYDSITPFIHTCMHNSVFTKIIHKTCIDYQFIEAGRKAYIDIMFITYFTVCMYLCMFVCIYVCMHVCRGVYLTLLQDSIELFSALNHPASPLPSQAHPQPTYTHTFSHTIIRWYIKHIHTHTT